MPPDEDPFQNNLPHLGANQLEDEQDLTEVVDAAILKLSRVVPELRRLDAEIQFQQQTLRDAFPDAWPQFLVVDAAATARTADLAVELVRWAFTAGVRHGEEP